jgi:hypothetical protein
MKVRTEEKSGELLTAASVDLPQRLYTGSMLSSTGHVLIQGGALRSTPKAADL